MPAAHSTSYQSNALHVTERHLILWHRSGHIESLTWGNNAEIILSFTQCNTHVQSLAWFNLRTAAKFCATDHLLTSSLMSRRVAIVKFGAMDFHIFCGECCFVHNCKVFLQTQQTLALTDLGDHPAQSLIHTSTEACRRDSRPSNSKGKAPGSCGQHRATAQTVGQRLTAQPTPSR
jgi:hypothetical protein